MKINKFLISAFLGTALFNTIFAAEQDPRATLADQFSKLMAAESQTVDQELTKLVDLSIMLAATIFEDPAINKDNETSFYKGLESLNQLTPQVATAFLKRNKMKLAKIKPILNENATPASKPGIFKKIKALESILDKEIAARDKK